MEAENSLLCSQEPANGSYPEPDESSMPFQKIHSILRPHVTFHKKLDF